MKTTGIESPAGIWWKPAHTQEKVWFAIAFAWCMVLFAMMPVWHLRGGQNPTGIRGRTTPEAYRERANQFIADYRVGEENGIPIVEPPPGSDVYLVAMMWQWRPILRLQRGAEYTLHMSSMDVNHGFNLYPMNINFQVVPGYDYGLRVTPTEAGDFKIVCNEFCGVGHHRMVGKIEVVDRIASGNDADGAGRSATGTPAVTDRAGTASGRPLGDASFAEAENGGDR